MRVCALLLPDPVTTRTKIAGTTHQNKTRLKQEMHRLRHPLQGLLRAHPARGGVPPHRNRLRLSVVRGSTRAPPGARAPRRHLLLERYQQRGGGGRRIRRVLSSDPLQVALQEEDADRTPGTCDDPQEHSEYT